MKSKLLCAETLSALGIPMSIGSGLAEQPITRLLHDRGKGTSFTVAKQRVKASKTWLATASVSSGSIVVSTYLTEALRHKRAASVLLAGIENVKGDFKERAVVEVCDDDGIILGRGLTRFSSEELTAKVKWYRNLPDEEKAQVKAADVIAVHYNDFAFIR